MIYTVTLNPCLDYVMQVPTLVSNRVNRTAGETFYPGGKGINVSILLSHLGISSKVLGFAAGFTGKEITRMVKEAGCEADFVELPEGVSRINVKIQSGGDTEVNAKGPEITKEALQAFFDKLSVLEKGDILVLAGSIPGSMPADSYEQILAMLAEKEILAVVDATGKLLENVLKYHPFLIKPNHHELGELFGVELHTQDEVVPYAKKLQEQGARNVLISMGGDGAVLLTENGQVWKAKAPQGKVLNTVGSGDSMVAGFIAGYLQQQSYQDAFYLGVASGSASAFSEWLAEKETIMEVYSQLEK